ncbi:hypothetical protein QQ045_007411 [Rhodiola kirilowii]
MMSQLAGKFFEVSCQCRDAIQGERSVQELNQSDLIREKQSQPNPTSDPKDKIPKETGSSFAEVAKPVLQKNEQEWQVIGRKKKGKKPIAVHAASVNAKNQETEDVAIEVKEISLPVESALQRKQRKEAEEILEIRESVGIISSVPREEAIQSLISYLREGREKDEKGRKRGTFLKRGERGVP